MLFIIPLEIIVFVYTRSPVPVEVYSILITSERKALYRATSDVKQDLGFCDFIRTETPFQSPCTFKNH